MVVKLAGACYLLLLGLTTLRQHPRRRRASDRDTVMTTSDRRLWVQGFLSAALNPKLGLFFVTLLPQFVTATEGPMPRTLQLAILFALIGLAWLLVFTELLVRVGGTLRGRGAGRVARRLSGIVLVGLGLRIALTKG
jgi:threonine/homoserine/homoserine lactone efflux protein